MGYGDVYVANTNGVAGSYNYGKTWELVSYGLLSKNCQVITGDMNLLLVSPAYFGVWKLPLSKNNASTSFSKIENNTLPSEYKLQQNYPNPFNPVTRIDYDLPADVNVSIKIFDVAGREIKTLVNENQEAGYYTMEFNASNLASGVYFYRIIAGDFLEVKRMVLIK
jgi:beta-lactamase class A